MSNTPVEFTLEQLRYLHETYPNDMFIGDSEKERWQAQGRRQVVDHLLSTFDYETKTSVHRTSNG